MSETASVQSATSNISSHSQNGIEPNYEGFKTDMSQFLTEKEGQFQCNHLIQRSAWKATFMTQYSPKETYGLTLQQLVTKYPKIFYFEGKGYDKWICLEEFRDENNPHSLKTTPVSNSSHSATTRSGHATNPFEPVIDPSYTKSCIIQDLSIINSHLSHMSVSDFIAIKAKLQEADLSVLKALLAP